MLFSLVRKSAEEIFTKEDNLMFDCMFSQGGKSYNGKTEQTQVKLVVTLHPVN